MIYYASLTGNTRRFIEKTGLPAQELTADTTVSEPFILVTYTTGFGLVPPEVEMFLRRNGDLLQAVAVSGNRNWGDFYGRAGDLIAKNYNVPLLLKFEMAGTAQDIKVFTERVAQCDTSN